MGGGNKNLVTLSQESQGSSRINLNVEQAFTLYLGQSVELPKFLFCRTSGEVGEASISQSNYKSSYFAEWAVKWAKPLSVSRMAKVVSLQNKWWGGRCLDQSVELQKLLFAEQVVRWVMPCCASTPSSTVSSTTWGTTSPARRYTYFMVQYIICSNRLLHKLIKR